MTNYGVIKGVRTAMRGKGVCTGLVVSIASLMIKEDCIPLEL